MIACCTLIRLEICIFSRAHHTLHISRGMPYQLQHGVSGQELNYSIPRKLVRYVYTVHSYGYDMPVHRRLFPLIKNDKF